MLTGPEIISPIAIVRLLLEGFERDIPAYPGEKCRLADWTASVKMSLRSAGQMLGDHVYCSDGTPGLEEYLLDVCWWNPQSCRLDVAFECEWGNPDAIAFDFEKLLWVKSRLKVMICDPQTSTGTSIDPLPKLREKLRRYPDHLTGEKYVVIAVGGDPLGGHAKAYVWDATVHPDFEELKISPPFAYTLRKSLSL